MSDYTKLTRFQAESILFRDFKIRTFYDTQWEAISRILNGERVLLIEKTGFGKSLCFQFPAIMFDGLTVIFSPLIALMRDQVNKLQALGITAKCINSNQTEDENNAIINEAKLNKLKILYIAPERQENSIWLEEVRNMKLSMVVVDEAHCISVWGHDFRPAYRRIINLVNLLPKSMPVIATTATATKRVEQDVAQQITGELKILRGNLVRSNFELYVIDVNSDDEKLIWLGENINKLSGTGIVYTGTIVNTEIISKWFEYLGISSRGYNGRLDSETRIEIEKGLIANKWKCVISTNALGMGIDKPDIRFIIHTQFPQSPVHYYQEIGRAGRDGKPTVIILLYNPQDRSLPEAFIEGAKPSIPKYHKIIEALKSEMLGEKELMKISNLRQTQFRVIKADLMDQGIIREIQIGKSKKYEFVPNSKPFDPALFEEVKKAKTAELESMIGYAESNDSRMKYLCTYLGDSLDYEYRNCDNTGLAKHFVSVTEDWVLKLNDFHETYFPILEVETKNSKIVNGVAASYYGASNVGSAIHRCKYENGGDFPDFLISLLLKAYRKRYGNERYDLILYIPPTVSGDLVRNLANKISGILKIPISHSIQKSRITKEQKVFENRYGKTDNVSNAFSITDTKLIVGKKVLLIDDIFDSGATIKEVGKYLTDHGAISIAPLVLAKTVGGDNV
ncbi:MAG: RecQ family ATP-dependent DNA helicase [Candidatus Cloacimonetes bacterium]|nr:RecQ family ATP-dependent DNA helicase [Candidatus Cloacimonadota bacterium]MDD3234894.1 RecQ family ATP-dependent DNA helicase [Candidatus Cloacimonadota bacterium]